MFFACFSGTSSSLLAILARLSPCAASLLAFFARLPGCFLCLPSLQVFFACLFCLLSLRLVFACVPCASSWVVLRCPSTLLIASLACFALLSDAFFARFLRVGRLLSYSLCAYPLATSAKQHTSKRPSPKRKPQRHGNVNTRPYKTSLGFQRPLKEWSRSLDRFLPKDRFLRLALNIQKIMVFVAQELLRVRTLKVTPPSSSQLQMTAPKPLIPWLAKCMVASLFKIARSPAYCRGVRRFFAWWY